MRVRTMTPKKIALLFAGMIGAAVLALILVNAVDYYRFHSVIRRLESLSEEQFRTLGDAAARVTQPTRADGADGFDVLKPIKVNLSPKSSDFLLYELKPMKPQFEDDNIYLYLRISTSPNNQEILYFTNSEGKQRTKVLWNRNPEFVHKHSPGGRILTINQWSMSESLTWIVLNDRILTVSNSGRTGGEPSIEGSVALDAAGLARIKVALENLPASSKGKDYRTDGVMDGIALDILFDPDGNAGPEDISISNTWVEEFRPLLTAVSELGLKDLPIGFIEDMTTDEHLRDYPTTVRTRVEWDKIEWGEPSAPWWCVWRKWFD